MTIKVSRRRFLGLGGGVLAAGVFGVGGVSAYNFESGRQQVDAKWASERFAKLAGVGEVQRLSVLPLVEWYAGRDGLATEPGLSYLIRADDRTILFDIGLNLKAEHPSPLLRNAAALGVELREADMLVISHPHADHLGGKFDRVAPSAQPFDFGGVPAYLPVPLDCPTARAEVVTGPRLLAPGVASIGPLQRQDLVLGTIVEQSLAVNVSGKGIVLIVGCGHTTVQRIVERAEMLFDAPVYGVIGGLHFSVTESRAKMMGLSLLNVLTTGKYPWDPIDGEDVAAAISFLRQRQPKVVALSAHDSCDWTLGAFKHAFGAAYREVRVGQEIVV